MFETTLLKLFAPTAMAFIVGILITPVITHFLYACKAWKKAGGKHALDGREAVVFNALHKDNETKTPRMGGIVIWGSVLITIGILFILGALFSDSPFATLDFFSRSQTWIPIATLIIGAGIGFLNDFYDITRNGQGIRLRTRLLFIVVLASIIGWWFFAKLGITAINIPFDGALYLGVLIIPFFVLFTIALYASGVIDGIDGLSGGVFVSVFAAYAGIAYIQAQYDLAAFSGTVAGATLAFLWFNIPPARFWMTETGTMPLTLTLAVVAFMTDTLGEGYGVSLILLVGLPLVATVASNVLQVLSKKMFGRKLFHIAPLHHHFEAIGWAPYKVTMRYWVISIMCAIIGLGIASIL